MAGKFACDGCGKQYNWKPELAGRKVKCGCGQVMTAPAKAPAPPPVDPDAELDIFALAEEQPVAAPKSSPRAGVTATGDGLAPVTFPTAARATATRAAAAPAPRSPAPGAIGRGTPLGYATGPTNRDRERASIDNTIEMFRDVYAPIGVLLAGLIVYVGYYAVRYSLDPSEVAVTAVGLSIMTAIKASLLIAFAFLMAGPLGVSFGGIWTAILKLAAIAMFSDAVTTLVDAGMDKIAAGTGMGMMVSFPIALATYWILMIWLFAMDAGDSWMVVICLAVFDFIVRTVLVIVLLNTVMGWSGVTVPVPGGGGGAPVGGAVDVQMFTELQEQNLLAEATEFIAGGRQAALKDHVDNFYAAGAPKVWFELGYTAERKPFAQSLVVEMPKDKAKRDAILVAAKAYLVAVELDDEDDPLTDDGARYLFLSVR